MSYQEDSAVVISAAQLKKLGAENEKLRAERDTQVMLNNALNSQNTKLRADLKLAVDALKSYAGMPMRTSDGSKYSYDSNSFENDNGTQAREALAKLQNSRGGE